MKTALKNFSLSSVTQVTVTADDPSVSTPLPIAEMSDLMLYNPGPNAVFVRTGDSTVTADLTALIIPPGEKGVYQRGETSPKTSHIAAFSLAPQTLYVAQGYGS